MRKYFPVEGDLDGFNEFIPSDHIPVAGLPDAIRDQKSAWLNTISVRAVFSAEVEDGDLVVPVVRDETNDWYHPDTVWVPALGPDAVMHAENETGATYQPKFYGMAYKGINRVMLGPLVYHPTYKFRAGDILYATANGKMTTEQTEVFVGACLAPGYVLLHGTAQNIDLFKKAAELTERAETAASTSVEMAEQVVEVGEAQIKRMEELAEQLLIIGVSYNKYAVADISVQTAEGTQIALPEYEGAQMSYIVGSNTLLLCYNGTWMLPGEQYTEVGTAGLPSAIIQLSQELRPGDKLGVLILSQYTKVLLSVDSGLGFKENGELYIVPVTAEGTEDTRTLPEWAAAIHTLEQPVLAEGTTIARSLVERFADVINVRDFGAVGDGVTDDTEAIQAAQSKGATLFLPDGLYKIDALPRCGVIGSGDFLVGHKAMSSGQVSVKFPFENASLTAIDIDQQHKGLNAHLFYDPAGRLVCVYRKAWYHGVASSAYVMRESLDMGQTWSNETTVYNHVSMHDLRCSVSYFDDSVWVILVIRRVPSATDASYDVPRVLISTDKGRSWTINSSLFYADDTAVSAGPTWNFHGNIIKTDGKLVAYAYNNDNDIDAFVSSDNGASWVVHPKVIVHTDAITSLSETSVARVGQQLIAFIRTDTNYVAIAKATDETGLSWQAPVLSNIPLGRNPYSVIEDGDKSWVLVPDRKLTIQEPSDRNKLFLLCVDQAFIDSDFQTWHLREVMETPHYSVGHFWGIKAAGQWIGVVNAGEVEGSCAALYCVTPVKPAAISRKNMYDVVSNPNLIINGGFRITRFGMAGEGNYRYKYFTDGFKMVHGRDYTAQWEIVHVNKNTFATPPITSDHYCHINLVGGVSFVLAAYVPCGTFGFKKPLTISFLARGVVAGQTVSVSLYRYQSADIAVETVRPDDAQSLELTTYWKRYTASVYGFRTSAMDSSTYADGVNSYDALNLTFTGDANGDVDIYVTDIKVEFGDCASAIVYDDVQDYTACCRYYYTTAENVNDITYRGAMIETAAATGVEKCNFNVRFPVPMWQTPTVTCISPNTGTSGKMYDQTGNSDVSAIAANIGKTGAVLRNSDSLAVGTSVTAHCIADARPDKP